MIVAKHIYRAEAKEGEHAPQKSEPNANAVHNCDVCFAGVAIESHAALRAREYPLPHIDSMLKGHFASFLRILQTCTFRTPS